MARIGFRIDRFTELVLGKRFSRLVLDLSLGLLSGGEDGDETMAGPDSGPLDEVVAEHGAGQGGDRGDWPALENRQMWGWTAEVADEEELLPKVNAVGE